MNHNLEFRFQKSKEKQRKRTFAPKMRALAAISAALSLVAVICISTDERVPMKMTEASSAASSWAFPNVRVEYQSCILK